jgi:hypothetical protein
MDFRIYCQCGLYQIVTEAAAEGWVDCPCGLVVTVPTLREMRVQAGLPPYHISPEKVIEYLLLAGQLPGTRSCAQCSAETDNCIQVGVECERKWKDERGGFTWSTVLFAMLFGWFVYERATTREYGDDKIYVVPLPICNGCQPTVRGRKKLKQALSRIPEYNQLLEKFPDARLTLR